MANIGPGETYPFTSALTGGLFVCSGPNTVWTGCSKWGPDRPWKNGILYKHIEQFSFADNAKDQFIYINGMCQRVNSKVSSEYEYPRDYDNQFSGYNGRIGHFGTVTLSDVDRGMMQNSAMGVKAIGYSRAAYQQITIDEVVENLKYLYAKYCKEGG